MRKKLFTGENNSEKAISLDGIGLAYMKKSEPYKALKY